MFTSDGVPMLYNGMEVGDTTEWGAPALFEFAEFYRMMISLRHAYPTLPQGETEWLVSGDSERVVAYVRRAAGEDFLVAINCSNRPFSGRIDVGLSAWTEVTRSKQGGSLPALGLAAESSGYSGERGERESQVRGLCY